MNEKNINKAFILLSISCFLASLTQKAYCLDGDSGEFGSGLMILVFGWLGIALGGASICWFANPLLIISYLITLRNLKLKLRIAMLTTVLGFSFLLFPEVVKDEAGHFGKVTGYELGYWLWVASPVIYLIGILFIKVRRKNVENQTLPNG